jgi:hypothetical protein
MKMIIDNCQDFNCYMSVKTLIENTYRDAFGLKDFWEVYYDPPKPRIMNALSLSSSLIVMQFLGDVSRMDGHLQ